MIGLAVISLLVGGWWYLYGRPTDGPSALVMTHTPEKSEPKGEVRCPVTGEKVDPATAFAKTVYKGKTYYFCCAGCPEEFKKNPEKYIKLKN